MGEEGQEILLSKHELIFGRKRLGEEGWNEVD